MSEIIAVKLSDQHYWVDKYFNNQPVGMFIFHGYEELVEGLNDLIEEAGVYLKVPVVKDIYSREGMTISVRNEEFDNEIRFDIQPAYTEEECIAAGLIDAPGTISLDANVWGAMFSTDEYHKFVLPD